MDSEINHSFNVNLSSFNGPLETLLDLAKSQKVNLENISITKLADQFYEFITHSKTEWLSMRCRNSGHLRHVWKVSRKQCCKHIIFRSNERLQSGATFAEPKKILFVDLTFFSTIVTTARLVSRILP